MNAALITFSKQKLVSLNLIVAAVLAVLILLLWAHTGPNVGFVMDGWNMFRIIENSPVGTTVFPSRPFLYLTWLISYGLSPDQFWGANLVLAVGLWCKGWLSFQLMRRLNPGSSVFAFVFAVMVTVYPADSAIFYLGAIPIHWALVFTLGAIYLFLLYMQSRRLSALIAMGLLQMLAVGTYEISYIFIGFTPLADRVRKSKLPAEAL